jgi:CheY-like chemotaxis protein
MKPATLQMVADSFPQRCKFVSATKPLWLWFNQKGDGHVLEYLLRGCGLHDMAPRRMEKRSALSRSRKANPHLMKNNLLVRGADHALRILSVDDEPSVAACLSFIFERPRYELTSARHGGDALTRLAAATAPYDVVITDNEMPCVSGIELVRELRERSFGGKIIVLSGYLTNEMREAYARLNVDAIVEKPFDNYELRHRLDLLVA